MVHAQRAVWNAHFVNRQATCVPKIRTKYIQGYALVLFVVPSTKNYNT